MEEVGLSPRLRRLPRVTVLGREVPVATGPRARLLGLSHLDLADSGRGLLIPRCSGVHTFGMRFALDLVFLNPESEPIAVHRAVPPRRFVSYRPSFSVLELPVAPDEQVEEELTKEANKGPTEGENRRPSSLK